jgi:hypothetical protein
VWFSGTGAPSERDTAHRLRGAHRQRSVVEVTG